ncbi:peptidoglycan DD-metalloendopeptidase family protein [Legionella brunensis]|uniref:LysM domain-containing protein n=1 Tax=Legionella brunensis TaxID=29422 RepID=A0A0W0S4A0_9GAMM|nr:peptidoglycan DD-metalloendopeptidase family protein [Legionella brunensis]KTC78399.1 hypothetical protein Lbru_2691 [Legionella brunensis]
MLSYNYFKNITIYKLCVLIILFLLAGCESRTTLAPVVESKWRQPYYGSRAVHVVQRGDTLYSIAFRYDKDYRDLASFNHLPSPYALKVGQVLRIGSASVPKTNLSRHTASRRPIYLAKRTIIKRPAKVTPKTTWTPFISNQSWIWPVNGRVATGFVPQQGKKGIDIAGKKGEKIRAASNGVVAYSGSGLSGYGNLIIIKHNNQFLTAYGNNLRNLVTEGQKVKAGQIIAEMGVVDRRFWGVHFEIRRAGKPVNPLSYLRRG